MDVAEFIAHAFQGDVQHLRAGIQSGVLVNAVDEDGPHRTALHAAVEGGDIEALALLLAHGADVDALSSGSTVLGHAVEVTCDGAWQQDHEPGREDLELLALLLRFGADPRSGLDMARRYESTAVVELLERAIAARTR